MFSPDVFTTTKSVNMFFDPKKMALDSSVSYPCSNHILLNSSAVMTPTSPQTFYLPSKSFDDTTSTEFQVQQDKSTTVQQTTYENDCFNWFDMGSMADTPNSIQSAIPSASTATAKTIKEEIFNFEPEYIEFFQRCCDNDKNEGTKTIDFEQPDAEYINYNESNCQSKSICASPGFETWMNSSDSASPKPTNTLPPISTISEQFQANYLDQDNFALIEDDPSVRNDVNFQSFNNFNLNQVAEVKADRDEKNIWEMWNFESSQPESPTDNVFIDEIVDCKNEILQQTEVEKISNVEDDQKDANSKEWICQWEKCFKVYPNQCELVKHIEKTHIEVKKGDVFSCYWLDCTRQHKPFNARYKLLIHMRVHSGEKPNRCQVSASKSMPHLKFVCIYTLRLPLLKRYSLVS